MTTQSRFNPDGSLHLNGDLFINEQGNLTVGGTANVTGNVNISGSTVIEGDLRVEGTTVYVSDTVAQNSSDGYIIDFDNDAVANGGTAFYQFGPAGAKMSWDGSDLVFALENGSTIDTYFTGPVDVSQNITANGILTANAIHSNTTANATTFNGTTFNGTTFYIDANTSMTSGRFTGTSNRAHNLTTDITLTLTGDVTGSATFGMTSNGGWAPSIITTIQPDSVTLGTDTIGTYVSGIADAGNGNLIVTTNTVNDASAVAIDLGDSTVTPGSYGNATHTASFTVDSKGRITSASEQSANISSGQINNFVASVRSNVSVTDTGGDGSLSYNNSTGVFTYTGPSLAEVQTRIDNSASNVRAHLSASNGVDYNSSTGAFQAVEGEIQHDNLDGYVAAEHVNHDNVTLTAGTGLTGGGTIASSRTFNVIGGDGITANANDIEVDSTVLRTSGDQSIAGTKTFTGSVDLTGATATATTQSPGSNNTVLATTAYVEKAIVDLVGDAPAALDTLGEIANALIDDANLGNVLTAKIVGANADIIERLPINGNTAMTGELTLSGSPTGGSNAATKNYVDTVVASSVDGANTNIYGNLVNKNFELQSDWYRFSHTGNSSNASTIAFGNSDIIIEPNLNDSANASNEYPVLIKGTPLSGPQNVDKKTVFRDNVLISPGYGTDPNWPVEAGAGIPSTIITGNIIHARNSNTEIGSNQFFASNVDYVLRKGNIDSNGGLVIQNSNISMITDASDSVSTYTGADTTGDNSNGNIALSTIGTYSNTIVGVERAHFVNFGKSTMFVGDFANVATYTSVYDKASESDMENDSGDGNTYTTGGRPLERLTVDGAIQLGARHTPEHLLVNGTIFYDASENKLKGVQNNRVIELAGETISQLTVGDGTSGDFTLSHPLSGNVYFLKQLTAGTGIDGVESGNANTSVITLSANPDYIVNVALANISSVDNGGDGSFAYNSATGVFTYTGPSASETRAHFSGSSGVNYDSSTGAITGDTAEIRGMFSAGGDLSYDSGTGVFSFTNDAGDIESVTAGDGMTGGGVSGAVTLNVVGGTGITASANDISLSASGVSAGTYGNADSIPTITVDTYGRITSVSENATGWKFTTDTAGNVDVNTGSLVQVLGGNNIDVTHSGSNITISTLSDITSVIAGNGLTGGGSSGDVTLNVDETFLANIVTNVTTTGDISAANVYASGFFEGDLNGAVTIDVINNTSNTIAKGTAVYLTGGNSGDNPHIAPCDNTDPTKMPAIGIVMTNIGASALGQVVTSGVMNFSSHGYTSGADLYIQLGGTLTTTVPSGENELLQKVGKVVTPNHIIVQGAFRTNAVPNLNSGNIFVGNAQNQSSTADLSNFTYEIISSANIETTANLVAQALVVNGNANVSGDVGIASDVIIEGNLTVNGVTTTISATTLSVDDNMIYFNANSNVTNPDLGFAGNYNDGTYAHAGFFRDTTDGYWKVYDGYTLEPDAAIDIDTTHASFNLADMRAGTFRGNLVVPGQYSLPTSDGTASQVLTTDGNGTVSFTNVSAIGLTSVTGGDGLTATPGIGSVDLDVGAGDGIIVGTDTVSLNVAYTRNQFSAGGDLSYNSTTGVMSYTTPTMYADSDARSAISVTDAGGLGSASYNSGTGVITYTGPSNADIRGLFSASGDISYNGTTGEFSFTDSDTVGTVTNVTVGTGLDVANGTTTPSISLDLSELTDMTGAVDGSADELILLDAGVQSRKLVSEITLSDFNNDLGNYGGWSTTTGTVTNVTVGTGLDVSNGTTTPAISLDLTEITLGAGLDSTATGLSLDLSDFTDMTGAVDGTQDELILLDNGSERKKLISEITLSDFNNDLGNYGGWSTTTGTVTNVSGGAGLTGSVSTSGSLAVGAGTGITVNANDVAVDMSAFSTSDLSEGTNNYYTTARANSAIDTRVTKAFVDNLGINADTFDSLDSGSFLRSDTDDTHSSNIAPGSNNTYQLGTSGNKYANVWATTFRGVSTSAQYADLAENYEADADYEPGTVLVIGGESEVTISDEPGSYKVVGVVSTDPAYLMNSEANGVAVALRGRVPCKVTGVVKKGDVLIASDTPGHAMVAADPKSLSPLQIIGRSLQTKTDAQPGVVEIIV